MSSNLIKTGINKKITRKNFIEGSICSGCALAFYATTGFSAELFAKSKPSIHPAEYWKALKNNKTKCLLCPNGCIRAPGQDGLCLSRGNRDGKLSSLTYANPCIIALDNIEKTPLYHFQVKGRVFSIATAGCNLHCKFCQNWEYSQAGPDEVRETFYLPPEDVISRAKKHNVETISFFYTDPVVYYEYMKDIARLARKAKMKTVCVTAGYINEKPLRELIPLIDAFVIGLKGFTDKFYREYIGGTLEPVLDTIRILSRDRDKTWMELVNLLIPGINDKPAEIKAMTRWIANEIGKDVPLHFTKFEPAYKMKDTSPTPVRTLEMAYEIGKKSGLEYIYLGNVPGSKAENTYCPKCGKLLIERLHFKTLKNNMRNGRCSCGHELPGKWIK